MAGHSHFKNIKRKKEARDLKKAHTFSKFARLIISSVREKGKDPQSNPELRTIIENAKAADMPKENIERAIKRGAGEGNEGKLQPFLFEAYGPEGVALLIKGSTDNRNRDLNEVKEILKRHEGKLADPGSVQWMFEQKGIIEGKNEESVMIRAIEGGAEDVEETEGSMLIYTAPEKLGEIKDLLGEEAESFTLGWRAQSPIETEGEKHERLIEELESMEAVEEVYHNVKK